MDDTAAAPEAEKAPLRSYGLRASFSITLMDRIQMLTQVVNENPNDAFARYGLAMEYSKANEVETAMQHFNRLVELHPDYAAGYFMAAQLLARVSRTDEAKQFLTKGIAAAARSGNAHAKGEMEGMLAELA